MPQRESFDVVVLGSGQGGKQLAWSLGKSGKKVAVVERRWVGGSCPAVACMPSKNELWSARVAHIVRHAAEFGTLVGDVKTDMRNAYKASGAELVMGVGRFIGPKTIEVALNDGGVRLLEGARGCPQSRLARRHSRRSRRRRGEATYSYRGARFR